ncbi:MAG TPA: bifunctional UDP-N-acetylmuramoyl-tripeptide:D-alanyl-D-alanine ligase/alanine racemase [Chitinophagaceae bacterium]
MKYSINHIAEIVEANAAISTDNMIVEHLLLDSRKIASPNSSLFFALKGPRRDGHQFIPELYKKGIRNFVISESINGSLYPGANFLLVDETLVALQQLASYHRQQFSIPVIGISGSNGKTVVKEWLYQLLHEDFNIVRSPKSYNSQIGVPLSVWQLNELHTLGIFEAGISEQGEMLRLERVIKPTIGVLTNIGEAHSNGFNDDEHKFREKMVLFRNCEVVIGREIDFSTRRDVLDMLSDGIRVMTWGNSESNDIIVQSIEKQRNETRISLLFNSAALNLTIPFTDEASIENVITCVSVLLQLGIAAEKIEDRIHDLHPVNMRLELKKGINNCSVINDSYSADLSSLQIAIDFLQQQSGQARKTVILSDFLHSSIPDDELYNSILDNLLKHEVTRFIAIGEKISTQLSSFSNDDITVESYSSTDDFIQRFRSSSFRDEVILVKGARVFGFEKIVQLLEQKAHQTVLEINLNAIAHNLKEYQKLLKPSTKIMAMVKAFAYGSGGAEIAGILQFHKVDYLGVAYADEGVELRRAGITLPIMVMNPEERSFEAIVENNLEPEIYSLQLFQSFDSFIRQEGLQHYPVHIEIETGMNRLGFAYDEIEKLASALNASPSLKVQTVFSHLAGSEEAMQDNFTLEQFEKFKLAADLLQNKLGYSFLQHISNSAAVVRHPELQLDMVRLGIGLYGVDSAATHKPDLQTTATLKSTIAQLKHLKAGESVSYNRKGVVKRDSVIATVRLGYADGYPRRLGNGAGQMLVNGKLAPVIGTVCMDMTMIDVTGMPGVNEGDEVIVFGKELSVEKLSEWAGTIPYEIMTGVSQRVKRVYYEE